MHLLSRAALCCLVALSLTACATLQPPGGGISGALTAKDTFDRVCRTIPTAYALFTAYTVVKPVPRDLARKVTAAYGQAQAVCTNPPTDIVTAAAAASRAYLVLTGEFKKRGVPVPVALKRLVRS